MRAHLAMTHIIMSQHAAAKRSTLAVLLVSLNSVLRSFYCKGNTEMRAPACKAICKNQGFKALLGWDPDIYIALGYSFTADT
jgi:hypothetical protein